ncbi:MAG TPA: VWA domain-containing protein [Pyrinomonadaceae bacterium]|jgi:Ca-activated chloride channel family protein|nr:VWA domain-containing protein [Pyrinomonadaceae bacterium]
MADPRRATFLLSALAFVIAYAHVAAAQSPAPAARAQTLSVVVTDKNGHTVKGLKAEDFAVFQGKTRLPLVSFGGDDEPASVGIVYDASSSVTDNPDRVREITKALFEFLNTAHPSNDYFVVAFNQKPQLLLPPTADRAAVGAALARVAVARPRGETALYDALYLAVDKAAYGRHAKRALLVISDGRDTVSQYSLKDARRALIESDVTVFVIGLHNSPADLDYSGRAILEELAYVSGGRLFVPSTTGELRGSFEMLGTELRHQYRLGFVPAPSARKDGWHELKIKVADLVTPQNKKVSLVARSRPGFYEAGIRR